MHKRPAISELFLKSLKRFIKAAPSDYEIDVMCVVTDYNPSFEYNYGWVNFDYHSNDFISNKWNYGIEKALEWQWDYLFLTDDDDFFLHSLWDAYAPLIEKGEHYFGLKSIYFHDLPTSETIAFTYRIDRIIGCGRMISRKCVENCVPLMESGLNRGLNNSLDDRLKKLGYKHKLIEGTFALDIKTKHNIWQIENYQAFSVGASPNVIYKFLNEDEVKFLNTIDNEGNYTTIADGPNDGIMQKR